MLSVVIPAYNEEQRIRSSLEQIHQHFHPVAHEIIVVDDGSTDQTAQVVRSTQAPHIRLIPTPHNRGKGHAVRTGLLASRGDTILLTDADLSTPVTEFDRLRLHLADHAVVIGSRAVPGAKVRNNFLRAYLGKMANVLVRLLVPGIHDTQCGFKLLRRDAVKRIAPMLSIDGFGYDFELLFLAQKFGLAIKEVGVEWHRVAGSKVRFGHYFSTLAELLTVVRRNKLGQYAATPMKPIAAVQFAGIGSEFRRGRMRKTSA